MAYDLSNFQRTLALSEEMESWPLTNIAEKLVEIRAKRRNGRPRW
nr:hypothetical protein [Azospirillum sp. 412522]